MIQLKEPSGSSLYEGLRQYNSKGYYPFHMPGHKGNMPDIDLLSFDLTEVDGLDSLHHPQGLIFAAQKKAARVFGADESFFLVNGSTAGIMAVLCALGPEAKVLAARNSHRSFYSGLIFSGAEVTYLYPPLTKEGLFGGISPQEVEEALSADETIQAVFITSPTYEGFTSNLKKIEKIVHKYDKLLIVDEAHGAHFIFHPAFPVGALEAGADIVIQSLHKTLPALTQSAILHVRGERADRARLRELLSMLQTSSPSYIFMAMMSRCIDLLEADADNLFQNYYEMLMDFRESFYGNGRLRLLGQDLAGSCGIDDIDLGKLVFTTGFGLSGKELSKRLREHRVQIEMYGRNHILAMTSIFDTAQGFDMLKKGLEDCSLCISEETSYKIDTRPCSLEKTLPVMTVRQAFYAPKKRKESVPLKESPGFLAGEFVIPYPPGIPLIAPGERITSGVIERALSSHKFGISLLGQEKDGYIQIIKE